MLSFAEELANAYVQVDGIETVTPRDVSTDESITTVQAMRLSILLHLPQLVAALFWSPHLHRSRPVETGHGPAVHPQAYPNRSAARRMAQRRCAGLQMPSLRSGLRG